MSASKIRADYDQLTKIAQAFGRQAEAARHTLDALQQGMSTLQNGDWLGKGSDAFYAEMSSAVLPAMGRVAAAMDQAASTTAQISQIMKQAEDDSARLFRLGGSGATTRAKAPSGASAFNFDWEDVVKQKGGPPPPTKPTPPPNPGGGGRYTPPPNGPPPPNNPGGRVVKIEHGNRLTPQQIQEWRQQHPTAPVQKIDRNDSRHPKFSEEELTKQGFYKARVDVDDQKKVKTEIWLKDKKQDVANNKGEEIQIQRTWGGTSIYSRVPPGPPFFRDTDDFRENWMSPLARTERTDRLGNRPDQPITVEQLWNNGYYYAHRAELPDPFNPGQKIFREFWANDQTGTFIQIDHSLP